MLQYEAPRIQTNIGDPGQSIANAQRGFAQLGEVAQDIMTTEANRTKEEEIAARYAEQVEREVANRKADIEYRDKVFNTAQEEKEYVRELGKKENIAATYIARGDTKGLNQFLKDNPDAATINIAKMKLDADTEKQKLGLMREANNKKSERPLSEEDKRMYYLTKLDPEGKQGLVEKYIKSNWFGKSDATAAANATAATKAKTDLYKDVGTKGNASEITPLLNKAFALGASPYDVANSYYSLDMGGGLFDPGKPDVDVSSVRTYVNSLGKKKKYVLLKRVCSKIMQICLKDLYGKYRRII